MSVENEISEEQARLLEQERQEKETMGEAEVPASAQEDATATLREELAGMKDQWLRAMAEMDNIRKRAKRDQEEMSRYAITAFARDIVIVLESLIRASETIPTAMREQNDLLAKIGEGVDLTRDELLNIFEKYAIKRLDPKGQKFDHNFHQAVVQVENDQVEPGTVIEVVQAGYTIHDRLLRPAMVAVSKHSEPKPEAGSVDTMV